MRVCRAVGCFLRYQRANSQRYARIDCSHYASNKASSYKCVHPYGHTCEDRQDQRQEATNHSPANRPHYMLQCPRRRFVVLCADRRPNSPAVDHCTKPRGDKGDRKRFLGIYLVNGKQDATNGCYGEQDHQDELKCARRILRRVLFIRGSLRFVRLLGSARRRFCQAWRQAESAKEHSPREFLHE